MEKELIEIINEIIENLEKLGGGTEANGFFLKINENNNDKVTGIDHWLEVDFKDEGDDDTYTVTLTELYIFEGHVYFITSDGDDEGFLDQTEESQKAILGGAKDMLKEIKNDFNNPDLC